MSWMEKLYQTYENNKRNVGVMGSNVRVPLWPNDHLTQQAHVVVILNENADFQDARVVPKDDAVTIIPVTEASATRAGIKPPPHPLFDKLQYLTDEYAAYGGKKYQGHEEYMKQLEAWCASSHGHGKVRIVRDYLRNNTLISDLVKVKVLFLGEDGKLADKWGGKAGDKPEIFDVLPPNAKQSDAFVRFQVEIPGDPQSKLWTDVSVRRSWEQYQRQAADASKGLCYVSGITTDLAQYHPKYIRRGGDSAKILSSNDKSGYTFRGRFDDSSQAFGVGSEITQKAHSALRWLIGRQGFKEDTLAVVAWAVSGATIPSPLDDTQFLLGEDDSDSLLRETAAQDFGNRLTKAMAGYKAVLGSTDEIIIIALDSPSFDGRLAIKYYRELKGSEFLERIENWHSRCAWKQNLGKDKRFIGAPSPRDIARAAYGPRVNRDSKLMKSTVERLLPCIIDGIPIHRDLVISSVRRACNKVTHESVWEWEACLGVACALYNYYKKGYDMALEQDRDTRDYLYGRLFALADHMERSAQISSDDNRETNAGRLMQRFADCPFSTWKTIEIALIPYRMKLRANRSGLLIYLENQIDSVMSLFKSDDFCSDLSLSGEFLLGFHCQRQELWKKKSHETDSQDTVESNQ